MAISRHDPEWTRTIATAYLAGVRFKHVSYRYVQTHNNPTRWLAVADDLVIPGGSKIEVARKALEYLAGKGAPDMALHDPLKLME